MVFLRSSVSKWFSHSFGDLNALRANWDLHMTAPRSLTKNYFGKTNKSSTKARDVVYLNFEQSLENWNCRYSSYISKAVPEAFKCIHAQEKPITEAKWGSSFRFLIHHKHRQIMHEQTPVAVIGLQKTSASGEKRQQENLWHYTVNQTGQRV